MLIIRNQIQDPNFRSTSSTHSFQISTSWHLVYLCIFGLPKKIPQTLISFRMPIISQHLTMVPSPPPFVPLSPKQPKKTHRHLAPLLPGPHACWPWVGSEAICMIYPFPERKSLKTSETWMSSSWTVHQNSCVQLPFIPNMSPWWSGHHSPFTLPPPVLVLGKPYMWAP